MWQHILTDHLGQNIGEDGKVKDAVTSIACDWVDCTKYPQPTPLKLSEITRHLKTHVPSKRGLSDGADPVAKRQRKSYVVPAKTMSLAWEQTLVTRDDRKPQIEQAAGIPLSAVLVLRNIARNVVKTESEEILLKEAELDGDEHGGWNERLFRPVMVRLFEVMTENKAMVSPPSPNVQNSVAILLTSHQGQLHFISLAISPRRLEPSLMTLERPPVLPVRRSGSCDVAR